MSGSEMVQALAKRMNEISAQRASGARELQQSASPTAPPLASASALPSGVLERGQGKDALEGVWVLAPGDTVQGYVNPGSSTIMAFLPPWAEDLQFNDDYSSWYDSQQQVTVTVTAQSGPVGVRITPLLFQCDEPEWYVNQPDDSELCYWAGDGAPEEYWQDNAIGAGGALPLVLDPSNSSLYPSPLYYSSALWIRVSGPVGGVAPSRYTVRIQTAAMPTPSVSTASAPGQREAGTKVTSIRPPNETRPQPPPLPSPILPPTPPYRRTHPSPCTAQCQPSRPCPRAWPPCAAAR